MTSANTIKKNDIVQLMPLSPEEMTKLDSWSRGRIIVERQPVVGMVTDDTAHDGMLWIKVFRNEDEHSFKWPEARLVPADLLHELVFDVERLKYDVYRLKWPSDD